MPSTKLPYPTEFRAQMVEHYHSGRSATDMSREFGCSAHSIHGWVARDKATSQGHSPAGPLAPSERDDRSQLRREVCQLKQERDILAKATAWFANKGECVLDQCIH